MQKIYLFVDGSVNTQNKTGFGAYLYTSDLSTINLEKLKKELVCTRFENTSSTKLELQNLLFALKQVDLSNSQLSIFTDSQNILSLLERRDKLEKNNFSSKGTSPLKMADLYQDFFNAIDKINCEILKIKGHKKSRDKNQIDQIFTLVDRASRKSLRNDPG